MTNPAQGAEEPSAHVRSLPTDRPLKVPSSTTTTPDLPASRPPPTIVDLTPEGTDQLWRIAMSAATKSAVSFPRPLATPTDLTAEGTAQITVALNALAADAVALYLKTKNYPLAPVGAALPRLPPDV